MDSWVSWIWIPGVGGPDLNTWVCIGGFELLHWSAGILNERCEYYENNLSFYNDFLEVPLTNCDTVERDFEILVDVSCETPTFSNRAPRSPRQHLQK